MLKAAIDDAEEAIPLECGKELLLLIFNEYASIQGTYFFICLKKDSNFGS